MAGYADDKTEPATPRRRQEQRQSGQVARSQDLSAAVPILFGFWALAYLGPRLWASLLAITRTALTADEMVRLDDVLVFMGATAIEIVKRLAPFLLILFFVIIVTLLAQVGFLFTFKPLKPSLAKINPLSGLKRMFSIRSLVLAGTNFVKLLVVSLVAWLSLKGSMAAIIHAFMFEIPVAFKLGSSLMFDLTMRLAAALLVLALLDLAWQRYKHERDMRMTKEEVKDEFRSMDGDPKIKHRRREVQLQLAMQRLRRDVPTADVVVTNPTHVAVAIRYDAKGMPAPKVVSKGADQVALRIRQIAMEFGIPIVERPPLARALHEAVEVGDYVPERLYQAVAEILAYVYELTGRSPRGMRAGAAAGAAAF